MPHHSGDKRPVLIPLERELIKRIDHIAVDWDVYRKDAIERLLEKAVEEVEKENKSARHVA